MSPEIAIEFLFLQYQESIAKVTRQWQDNKDDERAKLEFEFKLYFEGFKYVGGGISRKVFLHEKSKRCFKIQYANRDRGGRELSPNELEMKSYLSVDREDRKYFAKPFGFINGEFDLMEVEYIELPIARKANLDKDTDRKVTKLINHLGNKYGIDDLHEGNYAVNEKTGEVKILDYAW